MKFNLLKNDFNISNIGFCHLANFKLIHSFSRQHSRGGGVAIFARSNRRGESLELGLATEKYFEVTGVKLDTGRSKMVIIGIYRSSGGNEDVFFSKFESLLTDLNRKRQYFMVLGDFNIDSININNHSTKRFVDLLRSFGLKFLITSPTRVTTSTQTAIDNIITNIPDVETSVVNTAISDHYGQEAIISGIQSKREPKITTKIRDTRPANITLLNSSLSKENWLFLNSDVPLEDKFNMFHDYLSFYINNCFPCYIWHW